MEITEKWVSIKDRQYEHEVIWPNNTSYNRLREIQDEYPDLTYNNKGYESLSREAFDKHKDLLDEITEICKETVNGFSSFNHFKKRKDGTVVLRLQYKWSDSPHFTGVGYFNVDYWNEKIHKRLCEE